MKYILQMMVDESAWQDLSPEQMQPMIDEIERFNDQLRSAGAWVSAEGLDYSANAKTVRVNDDSRTVSDGPHASGPHQFGGYWIVETDSIEDAVRWAEQVPMTNGAVEVRGLVAEDQAGG